MINSVPETVKSSFHWDLWHVTRVCRKFLGVLVKACVTLVLLSGVFAGDSISRDETSQWRIAGYGTPLVGLCLSQLCMRCYKGHSLSPHSLSFY